MHCVIAVNYSERVQNITGNRTEYWSSWANASVGSIHLASVYQDEAAANVYLELLVSSGMRKEILRVLEVKDILDQILARYSDSDNCFLCGFHPLFDKGGRQLKIRGTTEGVEWSKEVAICEPCLQRKPDEVRAIISTPINAVLSI